MSSDPRAHAVAQTLAALRLEGWSPTDEHVGALSRLVQADVSFADYLAAVPGPASTARCPPDGAGGCVGCRT